MSETNSQPAIRFASTSVVYPNGVRGLDRLDLLNTQRTTFQYSRVTLIVFSVFPVVLVIEQLSEAARRRLV